MRNTKQHKRLVSLTLKNFKGVKDYTINFDGDNVQISGANESGKTTLFDAYLWLFTGVDSQGRQPDKFGIKTRNSSGEVIHELEHSVEAVFKDGEGKPFKLKKVFQEHWTQKRGSQHRSFDTHKTFYWFDEEKVKKAEYERRLQDMISPELMRIITNPSYFPSFMHWKERREMLFKLVSDDVTTESILKMHPELSGYSLVLDGKSEEARLSILKERKALLVQDKKDIPIRIDELEGLKHHHQDHTIQQAIDAAATLEQKINDTTTKKAEIESGGFVTQLKAEKVDLELQSRQLVKDFEESAEKVVANSREEYRISKVRKEKELDKIDQELQSLRNKKSAKYNEYSSQKELVERQNLSITNINQKIADLEATKPKENERPGICPACERPFEEVAEYDHNAYLKRFNQDKAEQLKQLNEELLEATAVLARLTSTFEQIKKEGKSIESTIETSLQYRDNEAKRLDADIAEKGATYRALLDEQPKPEDDERHVLLTSKMAEIDEKIANHNQEQAKEIASLLELLKVSKEELDAYKQILSEVTLDKEYSDKQNEYRKQLKKVSGELDAIEGDLFLIEDFVKARANFVTEKVNSLFKHCSFRLFNTQLNEGISETCEVLGKHGVGYNEGMNNAQQVQVGLEIIDVLCTHFDLSMPVFIDNRESVSRLPDTNLQVISLVVNPLDKNLRVEAETEAFV
jgi:hypothetical protein